MKDNYFLKTTFDIATFPTHISNRNQIKKGDEVLIQRKL